MSYTWEPLTKQPEKIDYFKSNDDWLVGDIE